MRDGAKIDMWSLVVMESHTFINLVIQIAYRLLGIENIFRAQLLATFIILQFTHDNMA